MIVWLFIAAAELCVPKIWNHAMVPRWRNHAHTAQCFTWEVVFFCLHVPQLRVFIVVVVSHVVVFLLLYLQTVSSSCVLWIDTRHRSSSGKRRNLAATALQTQCFSTNYTWATRAHKQIRTGSEQPESNNKTLKSALLSLVCFMRVN